MSIEDQISIGGAYGGGPEKALQGGSPRALPLRKRLEIQKQAHVEQITRLEELLKLLDENPAIEKFQDLSARIGY